LPARIAEWEARAKLAVVPKAENEILAYLYRAQGDLAKARKAAEEAERNDLLEAILYEQADWKELARRPAVAETSDVIRWLGYRTAYSRLGGAKKQYEAAVKDLRTRAAGLTGGNMIPYTKGLFLNGQAGAAIELLQKSPSSAKLAYEILVAQTRIKEAFALVETARKAPSPLLNVLEILQARTLYSLGEKERALALLEKHAREVRPGDQRAWIEDLVESELAVGRRDQAFGHVAKVLAGAGHGDWHEQLFEKLFDSRGGEARVMWQLLRLLDAKEPVEKALGRLRACFEGKATLETIDSLLDATRKSAERLKPPEAAEAWRVLGEVALSCKQPKQAADAFRQAGTTRAGIRLGDLLAQKKQWLPAAAQYHAAYKVGLKMGFSRGEEGEGVPALALYLSGHALTQAGRISEGRERIERAHLLPLGDGDMRFDLVRALRKRGHRDAERREQQYLRRIGEPVLSDPGSYYTGEGLRAAGIDAAGRKDWLKAADGYEQTFLRCLQPGMNFARPAAYVTVPAHINLIRARGLVAAGRLDEALVESERGRASLPGSVDLAMYLVPELDRRGRKKDALALYREVRGRYEVVLGEYPRCAWACNQAAWLSACCRRDLEKGLVHARKAIELTPDSAAYHDTLAEVLFQSGKKDEAIAAQKKAIALQPKREYFRKQLKRLETGDPKMPRPEEEE
jgi:tetratricopeptide (TPR) repeat protein